ncbi:NAD-dependent epimerase/dehydratase family protein [Microlunatus flavus]|uniref:UDP-glucose 4-epimerase n=1 Tax=Microlunatus flavus TaxID=1036181 RepID=A0A1H8Z6N8_9ACTN|nr:NAD-dependent epimerase/dehydratase family protein [Microlunatus flavus]SEP59917.1 UDP-glucose 4-epimerase [Microlunatus flavus]
MTRKVLVTGASRALAARFARSLAADPEFEVIGVDLIPPRDDLGLASFVRADIRSPAVGRVVEARGVDTVVHMAVTSAPAGAVGRQSSEVAKEINVIGTLQLLAACQRVPSVRKLVVQSSVSVYGASPRDPASFTEDDSARVSPRTGFGKDTIEIESYVRGFARRRPDVVVTTLRLAALMGATVDSRIARYLALPVVPRVLGFDARLQFLHPDDAVGALEHAVREDVPGTFNVAAPDVVTLGQALRRMGRPTVGVPRGSASSVASLFRGWRGADFSADQIDALTYGRVMDTSRFAAAGFVPTRSSADALAEFVAASRPGLLSAERVEGAVGAVTRFARGVEERAGRA